MTDDETHWRKVPQPKYSRRQTEPNLGQYQARVLVDSRLRDDMQQPLPIEDLLLNYNPQNLYGPFFSEAPQCEDNGSLYRKPPAPSMKPITGLQLRFCTACLQPNHRAFEPHPSSQVVWPACHYNNELPNLLSMFFYRPGQSVR